LFRTVTIRFSPPGARASLAQTGDAVVERTVDPHGFLALGQQILAAQLFKGLSSKRRRMANSVVESIMPRSS
jgi:hypothetical protein